VLHELTPVTGSLEDAYLALTQDEVEYHAGGTLEGAAQ
jgi:ABC-2 type transport system ATP-binding protein